MGIRYPDPFPVHFVLLIVPNEEILLSSLVPGAIVFTSLPTRHRFTANPWS